MSKEDLEEADLPEGANPSQESQLANSVRNQSSTEPGKYPSVKRKETPANPKR